MSMGDLKVADGLDVSVDRSEGNVDLAVGGEIDIVNVDRFSHVLTDAVLETRGTVNVDLSDVSFVGSEAISTLIQVRKLSDSKGVRFRIVKASRRVESVLGLMGLDGYFE
jgi:anti-anti-sigma factor